MRPGIERTEHGLDAFGRLARLCLVKGPHTVARETVLLQVGVDGIVGGGRAEDGPADGHTATDRVRGRRAEVGLLRDEEALLTAVNVGDDRRALEQVAE